MSIPSPAESSASSGARASAAAGGFLLATRQSYGTVVLLAIGHFWVDLYSGSLGVLQPILIEKFKFNLTQVGLLGGAFVFAGSVMQPVFGLLSDRFQSRLFTCATPAIAAVFVSSLAYAAGFPSALLMIFLSGLGIAAYHPQGGSWSVAAAPKDPSFWLAVFITCGNLGIACGPALFSDWVSRFGFDSAKWLAVPGLAMTVVMFSAVRVPASLRARTFFDLQPLLAVKRPMLLLLLAVFFRSAIQITFTQMLPLYLHASRGYSERMAAWITTAYLAVGASGGFAGGWMTKRFGTKPVMMGSFGWAVPLLAGFFLLPDGWISTLLLLVGGLILLFTIPVNVVVAQRLAPAQAATVSAVMMGLGWGSAGVVFIPFTGWLADLTSLHVALMVLLICPVLGFAATSMLPKEIGE